MILCMEYMLQLSANLLNIRLPILWRKLNTKLWKSSESSVFRYLSTENRVSTEEFRKNNESTRLGFAVLDDKIVLQADVTPFRIILYIFLSKSPTYTHFVKGHNLSL